VRSSAGASGWLRRFDRGIFEGVIDGVLRNDSISGVVRDVVVQELRGVGVQLVVVFLGDLVGGLQEGFRTLGIEIGASDVNVFADVGGADLLSELVGGLIVIFRNLAMPVLVVDDNLAGAAWNPDVDL